MKRRLAAALSGLFVAALLPASATAEPAVRFEDHHIGFFCEQPIDGGLVASHVDVSEFGDFAGVEVWLDPAIPFEDPPSVAGGTETVTLTALASGFELSASFTVLDTEGSELGEGSIEATLTPSGDPEVLSSDRFGNRTTLVSGTFQPMDVSGTVTMPGVGEVELAQCGGDETFITVIETNPHTFVLDNEGIVMNCFWETDDSVASLFVIDDSFGPFADAFLATADVQLVSSGFSSLEFTAESMSVVIDLFDAATGDPAEATAEASLTPLGDLTTSLILSSSSRDKLIEQRLSPSGELSFSTGDTFALDDTACFANTFESHLVDSAPAGPMAGGRAPVNDTPDGALPLTIGSRVNTQTGGAALEPEVPVTTCSEGEIDSFGRTLWYTFEGTGGEATLDTAGSNFDTLLAVYVLEGDELVEIACVDDVFFDPIGLTFQAAITGPTEEGVTYWIQVGGFDARIFGGDVEFGRLRISVS
jgi:hypothetical protein